ncbi:MAG: WG repeat-containing protein [Saprospiraceae bacterium]|nr:WG repeat-containing protein [Saprospiraceae bacterium]MCB9318977.1 WG repeat-containing protein [Lewinellaceae bacterium]
MKNLTSLWLLPFLLWTCWQCRPSSQEEDDTQNDEAAYFEDFMPTEDKWGFLDETGQVVIPAQFDQIGSFSQNLCPVNTGGKWGYIRPNGAWAIPAGYKGGWMFNQGIARVWNFDGSFAFIDTANRILFHPAYDEVNDLVNGRIRVITSGNTGFLNRQGKEVVSTKYQSGTDFNPSGLAKVKSENKYGLIDTLGTFRLPAVYDWIGSLDGPYIALRQNRNFTIYDQAQNEILPGTYDQIAEPLDRVSAVQKSGKWYLLDLNNSLETPLEGTLVQGLGSMRWSMFQDQKWYLVDASGTLLNETGFKQINRFQDDRACCMQDELWGYLGVDGKMVITPRYGLAWDFVNGFARVADNKGIYFVRTDGTELFQPGWVDVRDFIEDRCPVQIHK